MISRASLIVCVALTLLSCGEKRAEPREVDPRNVVEPAVLRPRLLQDDAEIQAYIDAMPFGEYTISEVRGQGKFYIDAVGDTIKNFLRKGIRWELHVDRYALEHGKKGTVIIDAGAHIGTHTLVMAKAVGDTGRVYAFEPQRKLYRELVHNMRLNKVTNVIPLRFALGAANEIIQMNPAAKGNEGGTGVGKGGDPAELRRLDEFGFKNVSFIKIDVEGFEDSVLEGARETIAANRPVLLVEIMGGSDYETATPAVRQRIDTTRRTIEELGYAVTKVSPHDYLALPR